MSWVTPPSPASGAGSSVTTSVQVLTLATDATLTGERVFVPGDGLSATDGGANSNYSLAMSSRVLEQSGASLTSTGTVTLVLVNYVIPPGLLSTNKSIRILSFGWRRCANATTLSMTFRVVLGATVLYQDAWPQINQTTPVSAGWMVDLLLTAENSANAQVISGNAYAGLGSLGATTGMGNLASDETTTTSPIFGSSAEDSSASLTLLVDLLPDVNLVNSRTFVKKYHVLRLI